MKKPPRWIDVYPQGTKEGDEEQAFFVSLSRNPKWQWRSVAGIAKEAGLTKERVEEILLKYYQKGMVFNNPHNEDNWGYWERVPEMLPNNDGTLVHHDHRDRLDNH